MSPAKEDKVVQTEPVSVALDVAEQQPLSNILDIDNYEEYVPEAVVTDDLSQYLYPNVQPEAIEQPAYQPEANSSSPESEGLVAGQYYESVEDGQLLLYDGFNLIACEYVNEEVANADDAYNEYIIDPSEHQPPIDENDAFIDEINDSFHLLCTSPLESIMTDSNQTDLLTNSNTTDSSPTETEDEFRFDESGRVIYSKGQNETLNSTFDESKFFGNLFDIPDASALIDSTIANVWDDLLGNSLIF